MYYIAQHHGYTSCVILGCNLSYNSFRLVLYDKITILDVPPNATPSTPKRTILENL
ncbi:hypothetical protein RchiOBHm_Chr3g0494661 [Rosa chinensis]|uniref:Uncharacterized protein n=1 Tax=Rosa chinensis TaxID=74649 RepID=A0A2P6RH15_ROSCH|nr:hypothetical protein RchiOBHm_Chr3g0494661 [Rosa chinensis]